MFDDFGGPGFDWNGNGTKDSFDHYMDMKAAGSAGSRNLLGGPALSIVILKNT